MLITSDFPIVLPVRDPDCPDDGGHRADPLRQDPHADHVSIFAQAKSSAGMMQS